MKINKVAVVKSEMLENLLILIKELKKYQEIKFLRFCLRMRSKFFNTLRSKLFTLRFYISKILEAR